MGYDKPVVKDYGELVEMTEASGTVGTEDGVGKVIGLTVGPVGVSVGIFP